jgi:hypothetical protein
MVSRSKHLSTRNSEILPFSGRPGDWRVRRYTVKNEFNSNCRCSFILAVTISTNTSLSFLRCAVLPRFQTASDNHKPNATKSSFFNVLTRRSRHCRNGHIPPNLFTLHQIRQSIHGRSYWFRSRLELFRVRSNSGENFAGVMFRGRV